MILIPVVKKRGFLLSATFFSSPQSRFLLVDFGVTSSEGASHWLRLQFLLKREFLSLFRTYRYLLRPIGWRSCMDPDVGLLLAEAPTSVSRVQVSCKGTASQDRVKIKKIFKALDGGVLEIFYSRYMPDQIQICVSVGNFLKDWNPPGVLGVWCLL